MTRTRTLALTALGLALAAAPAVAQDLQPRPIPESPDGSLCAPGTAVVTTPRLQAEVPAITSMCATFDPVTGARTGTLFADGAVRVTASTPRLLLKAGEVVTFAFAGAPTQVVTLEARSSASSRASKRTYRLSPYKPAWKARAGSGVLVVSTTLPSPGFLSPSGTTPASYLFAYRTVKR